MLMLGLFLRYGGRFLIYRHITNTEGHTLIVPLMGSLPDRTREAVNLFAETPSGAVVFVQPINPEKHFLDSIGVPVVSTAEKFRNVLVKLGIPGEKVQYLRGPAASTVEEADLMARFLQGKTAVKRIVLVSSSFHSRRAYRIFRDRFEKAGLDITINVAPSRYTDFNPVHWYSRKADAVIVVTEWLKMIYYVLIGQFQS